VVRRARALVAVLVCCAAMPAAAHATAGIAGTETLLPRGPYAFGQEVTAELDVLVNTKLVEPDALHADVRFDPYELVRSPQRRTLEESGIAQVRFRYVIQCASLACTMAPAQRQRHITFKPAVLEYTTRKGKKRATKAPWEQIVLVTRIDNQLSRPQTATQARLGTITLEPLLLLPLSVKAPPPSYRVGPSTLALVLALAALVALGAAGILARPLVVLVRRKEAAPPPLSPLEQAVVAVETTGQRQPGSAEHREALGLLARQLRRANVNELVNKARKLAWSEDAPTASESRSLARDVRMRMESGA
jgi:hypothetical protein